ncbi:OsmC family protein [Rubrivivax sp. A210]|uniref:OsmC family protein n=1 Tax=Rubrivivax sp. A210 TaxID=2772301 RepID=UPI00191B44E6|nr:OsmC family protein [Rubrivivax sp. A210]
MHEYTALIEWQREADEAFTDNRYHRRHRLQFDGGAEVAGSSAPAVVPLPYSDAAAVDPEEMFVAALSSCHMLWFLSLAAQAGYRVDRYLDQAAGVMARNAKGKLAMSRVTLRPRIEFGGARLPSPEQLQALHERAHDECFIANSVVCEVRCEPQ